jgi:sulfoxide reductase heme-binding subunit YedZ
LIYISAAAGVIHYLWLVKSDIRMPLLYGTILGVLLLLRPITSRLGRSATRQTQVAAATRTNQ